MSLVGSIASVWLYAGHFRSTLKSGHQQTGQLVRFVPMSEVVFLFDHFISAGEQRRRNGEPERLGGLEVERHFEFRRLHYGQIGRLLAFQDPAALMRFTHGNVRDPYRFVQNRSRSSAEKRRSSRNVKRSTFARFLGLFDFRILQQYLPGADIWQTINRSPRWQEGAAATG